MKTTEEFLKELNTTKAGLTSDEATKRAQQYGKNMLEEGAKKSLALKIWDQVKDPMILVLIGAAVVSGILGEIPDMCIILAVVVLNAIIGLVQEQKAEQAVEALKKMSAQSAKVVRDGVLTTIDSEDLVPGDLVVLDAGDLVPADLRLIETSSLKIEEASLTGESVPSEKDAAADVKDDAPIGDRKNMAYYGTGVTYGRARGVVAQIGMSTEMGKIAKMISGTPENTTPLQKKLAEIGKMLTVAVLGICVVIFAAIIFKAGGFSLQTSLEAFMIAVSLAVAAIPEGLPAVVTIVMALGVTRMAKRRAIIKKLPAVETLGCAQIICSDKTGTLTQNKMDVREVYMGGKNRTADEFMKAEDGELLLDILYLCNDSEVYADGREIGDPTETCLKRFALKKYNADRFSASKRISDLPFDSERKMMSTVNTSAQGELVYTKGAPDEVLKKCKGLTEKEMQTILNANRDMAAKALRVLGIAYKPFKEGEELENDLTFVGLVGMIDPPRPEAFEAIKKCKRAGITTIMITGDHRDTAVAIATELGIIDDPSQAVFGNVLDAMNDEEMAKAVQNIRVYARVSPQHKVRIVEMWQKLGKIVAMTGDGVNDAPALKTADIGVGMGITGTDVSKGVSDMLLSDDNFATIVNAVEEGRKIYTNIRKAVQFLLSSNISEVVSLFVATLVLPAGTIFLGPVHILWINLVTDALPAIGLGMNKGEDGVMNKPPRDANASIFSGGVGVNIAYQGLILSIITLTSYFLGARDSAIAATTMAFITLSSVQIFHSFNIKAGAGTSFSKSTFDNPMMLFGGFAPMVLVALIVNIAPLASIFKVTPLSLPEWGIAMGLAFLVIPIDEAIRAVKRKMGWV